MTGKDLIKLAESMGWELLRWKGDHAILAMNGRPDRLSIPLRHINPGLVSHIKSRMRRGDVNMMGAQNRGK